MGFICFIEKAELEMGREFSKGKRRGKGFLELGRGNYFPREENN